MEDHRFSHWRKMKCTRLRETAASLLCGLIFQRTDPASRSSNSRFTSDLPHSRSVLLYDEKRCPGKGSRPSVFPVFRLPRGHRTFQCATSRVPTKDDLIKGIGSPRDNKLTNGPRRKPADLRTGIFELKCVSFPRRTLVCSDKREHPVESFTSSKPTKPGTCQRSLILQHARIN